MRKKIGVVLAVVLMAAMSLTACLPESQATLDLRVKAVALAEEALAQRALYVKLAAEAKALAADARAGKAVDQARVLELLALLPEAARAVSGVTAKADAAWDAVKNSKGAPWYSYLITALSVAATVASIYFPALRPALAAVQAVTAQRNATIKGVEEYRLAPESDAREVEDFIRASAIHDGVEPDLNAAVKALTGKTTAGGG
ncbi:MAG: hypothetical protein FD189_1110 [Elusimicrobia bacterium]|nr:MAG: hypothetical protein FD189_1110 [Elusimicrobiota bacterium]